MTPEALTVDLTERYDPRRNPKQMEFHTRPEMFKLFGGALGGGKTGAIVNESLQLVLDYPGNFGLLMRKTWPSFRDTVFPQLEKFTPREIVSSWNLSEKLIEFVNGSRLRYGGVGDGPNDWQKFMGGEYGFIALDQAEEFTEQEFKMLSTRLRFKLPGIRYHFLMTCNPSQGWLKERFIERSLPDHVFIPALPADNLANLPPNYVTNLLQILDENQVKALLHGDWNAAGAPDDVFGYLQLNEAFARTAEHGFPIEYGVDAARSGDDKTVITRRQGMTVRIVFSAQGLDLMRSTGEIWRDIFSLPLLELIQDGLKKITIKVDADGLGAGIVDRLREQKPDKEALVLELVKKALSEKDQKELEKSGFKFRFEILEVHGAAAARDKARFKNQRAEIHWGMRELLKDLSLPIPKEVMSQFLSIKYKVNSSGQIEIVEKEKIKEKLGRSPDEAEAVIYALAHVLPPGPIPRMRNFWS
jgi:hypothetical protein